MKTINNSDKNIIVSGIKEIGKSRAFDRSRLTLLSYQIGNRDNESMKQTIADITKDNVISSVEKKSLEKTMEYIYSEFGRLNDEYNRYSQMSTWDSGIDPVFDRYEEAYENLKAKMDVVLSDLNTSYIIEGESINLLFELYYSRLAEYSEALVVFVTDDMETTTARSSVFMTINSSAGLSISGSTTLTAKIFVDGNEITNDPTYLAEGDFIWSRTEAGWTRSETYRKSKAITIALSDLVDNKAEFTCFYAHQIGDRNLYYTANCSIHIQKQTEEPLRWMFEARPSTAVKNLRDTDPIKIELITDISGYTYTPSFTTTHGSITGTTLSIPYNTEATEVVVHMKYLSQLDYLVKIPVVDQTEYGKDWKFLPTAPATGMAYKEGEPNDFYTSSYDFKTYEYTKKAGILGWYESENSMHLLSGLNSLIANDVDLNAISDNNNVTWMKKLLADKVIANAIFTIALEIAKNGYISSDGYKQGSSQKGFIMKGDGTFECYDGKFTGNIEATAGTFGGQLSTITIETVLGGDSAYPVHSGTADMQTILRDMNSVLLAIGGDGISEGLNLTIGGTINGKTISKMKIGQIATATAMNSYSEKSWGITYRRKISARVTWCPVTFTTNDGDVQCVIRKVAFNVGRQYTSSSADPAYPSEITGLINLLSTSDRTVGGPGADDGLVPSGDTSESVCANIGLARADASFSNVVVYDDTKERLYIKNLPSSAPSERDRIWADGSGFLRIVK